MKRCPNCHEEMDEDLAEEEICSECGEEFDEN
jgi:rRNA maturation endonuclease Nob1